MKKAIGTVGLFFVLAGLAWGQEPVKLGYVDSDRIRQEYSEFGMAQTRLDSEIVNAQRQDSILASELEKLQEELTKQAAVLSPAKKAEKEKTFEAKQAAYFQFRQATFGQDGKLELRRQNLSKPILEKVMAVIRRISKAEGYTFVFSAQTVVYANEGTDLTDKVLAELNKPAPADSEKSK